MIVFTVQYIYCYTHWWVLYWHPRFNDSYIYLSTPVGDVTVLTHQLFIFAEIPEAASLNLACQANPLGFPLWRVLSLLFGFSFRQIQANLH